MQETARLSRPTPQPVEHVTLEPEPKRSANARLLAVLALVAALAVGWFALDTLRSDDDAGEVAPSRSSAATESDSPIFEPIDDAENVVDQINDNTREEELLDELGLDPTGAPIPAGYRFTTVDADGRALNIQVDTTTGNYSIESADGFGVRSIDGGLVARATPADRWTQIDPTELDAVQRFGLVRLVSVDDLVTPAIEPWVSVVSSDEIDGQTTTLYRVDVAALNAEQPGVLTTWATPFGLDPTTLVTATSEPVDILVQTQPADVVRSFTINAPGADNVMQYRLDELYDDPPAITL